MRKTALPLLAVTAAGFIVLAGCGPSHSGTDKAKASALATSSQGQAAKKDARELAARCQPKGTSTSAWESELLLRKSAREALYDCEKIPPASRQAAGTCVISAAKTAVSGSGPKAARETQFIVSLGTCL